MDGSREVLIVATQSYDDAELRLLRSPAQDAESLARVLGDPAIGGFAVSTFFTRGCAPSEEFDVLLPVLFLLARD